jgi:predicted esterase YcpF (UPF0227 family)
MVIIFIHGKESDAKNSSKAQEIQDRFPEAIVSVPDYRPKERTFEEIDAFFKSYFGRIPFLHNKVLYLIGSSLGGYWALKWASQLNASGCILLNPALQYYGEPPAWAPSLPVTLLVCQDDTVVDPTFAVEFLTGNAQIVVFENGGHRMENTEAMLAEIGGAIFPEASGRPMTVTLLEWEKAQQMVRSKEADTAGLLAITGVGPFDHQQA